jgi:hypothetical protein
LQAAFIVQELVPWALADGGGGGWAWHQFGQNDIYLTQIPEPWGVALLFFIFAGARLRRSSFQQDCSPP